MGQGIRASKDEHHGGTGQQPRPSPGGSQPGSQLVKYGCQRILRSQELPPEGKQDHTRKDQGSDAAERAAEPAIGVDGTEGQDQGDVPGRQGAIDQEDAPFPLVGRRFRQIQTEHPGFDQPGEMASGALPQVGNLEIVAQGIVAIQRDQRIQVHQDRGEPADENRGKRHLRHQGARVGRPPDDGRDAGEYQLNPGTGCGNPEPGAQLRKGPGVIDVAEERRLEIDQHCTDLVHFAAEILAGEAMTQLVDRDNDGAGHPQHHQIP